MNLTDPLSPHFTIRELVISLHREIDNSPPPEIVERLRRLCLDFLEPIRAEFGPLYVSSGYRCPELNKCVGGQKTSAHMFGCAADFMPMDTKPTSKDVVRWVARSRLNFDQVIDEYSVTSNWVHIGQLVVGTHPAPRRSVEVKRPGEDYSPFPMV